MAAFTAPASQAELADSAGPADPSACNRNASMDLICGIPVPEDLVLIPETDWVIATSMTSGRPASGLYLIDTRTLQAEAVDLDHQPVSFSSIQSEAEAVSHCAPPDTQTLITHGISLAAGENGVHRLYVVGHGGREAIELFNVDANGEKPLVRWAGCVPLPEGLEANSVVGLPDGGLLFTSLYNPGETDWPARIGRLASSEPAGGVFEWQAGKGVSRFPIPPMSGPNGIAITPDGETIILAGWADRLVRRIDRQGIETASAIELNFLPDNLHWSPDGKILASGQRFGVAELFACITQADAPNYCAKSYSVARIDVDSHSLTDLWEEDVNEGFGDSTSAIMVDDRLWLGSINGDCIAVVTPGTWRKQEASQLPIERLPKN
ncbi:hypothetical protein [Parasphingorhabdus sp.]